MLHSSCYATWRWEEYQNLAKLFVAYVERDIVE